MGLVQRIQQRNPVLGCEPAPRLDNHVSKDEAEATARRTLVRILSPRQIEELDQGGLCVPSRNFRGRVYRIRYGMPYVLVIEQGRIVEGVCVKSMAWIPESDEVLARKLHIEVDEEGFLRTGCHTKHQSSLNIVYA